MIVWVAPRGAGEADGAPGALLSSRASVGGGLHHINVPVWLMRALLGVLLSRGSASAGEAATLRADLPAAARATRAAVRVAASPARVRRTSLPSSLLTVSDRRRPAGRCQLSIISIGAARAGRMGAARRVGWVPKGKHTGVGGRTSGRGDDERAAAPPRSSSAAAIMNKGGARGRHAGGRARGNNTTPGTAPDMEDLFSQHPGLAGVRGNASEARSALLAWYDARHRVLPWRRNPHSRHSCPQVVNTTNPATRAEVESGAIFWDGAKEAGAPANVPLDQYAYGVWVSEIMSQQTQIDRVAQYWLKWTKRWPTVTALAKAEQEEVNELWAGLGYYRRAKFLLDGARHVSDAKDGVMPNNAKDLGTIPGVGPYTAAAVASIAFGEPIAAVDGNVIRVTSRLACIRDGGDPTKPGTSAGKACKVAAESLLCHERPGDFNQAMMELGATVCTPRGPDCSSCPLNSTCAARVLAEGEEDFAVTDLPEKEKKAKAREEAVAVCVVEAVNQRAVDSSSSFLLVRRPEGGLLGGLWEFPSVVMTNQPGDSHQPSVTAAARARAEALLERLNSLGVPDVPAHALHVQELDGNVAVASNSNQEPDKCGGSERHDESAIVGRYVGEVVHVFSHIRQTMTVTHLTVPLERFENLHGGGGDSPELRWVTAADMVRSCVITGESVLSVHLTLLSPCELLNRRSENFQT